MPIIKVNHLPLLLLAVMCTKSMFAGTRSQHRFVVEALSSLPSKESSSGGTGVRRGGEGTGFKETLGGGIGIRPALSNDSYAHRSAIECSAGTIDVKIASEEKGLGAFATSIIPFGTLLGHYNGESFVLKEVRARFWNKATKTEEDLLWEQSRRDRDQDITGHFLFELPNGSFVDAEDADTSSWIRFLNHADKETDGCNVGAFIKTSIADDDQRFPLMYAISEIQVVRIIYLFIWRNVGWRFDWRNVGIIYSCFSLFLRGSVSLRSICPNASYSLY
jgi:hypothetical protein